jgi:hypothetical protein
MQRSHARSREHLPEVTSRGVRAGVVEYPLWAPRGEVRGEDAEGCLSWLRTREDAFVEPRNERMQRTQWLGHGGQSTA